MASGNFLSALEQPLLNHRDGRKQQKIKIRRFCIDDPIDKQAYEELMSKMSEATTLRFISEESLFSQKNDSYYVVVKWGEVL